MILLSEKKIFEAVISVLFAVLATVKAIGEAEYEDSEDNAK